jgi:hypothetical protein
VEVKIDVMSVHIADIEEIGVDCDVTTWVNCDVMVVVGTEVMALVDVEVIPKAATPPCIHSDVI